MAHPCARAPPGDPVAPFHCPFRTGTPAPALSRNLLKPRTDPSLALKLVRLPAVKASAPGPAPKPPPSHTAGSPMHLLSSRQFNSHNFKNMLFEMELAPPGGLRFGVGSDILGVDIGGYSIKAAPVDTRTGRLLSAKFHTPTPKAATPEACAEVVGLIVETLQWTGAVGIGVPSVIREGRTLTASHTEESWIGADAESIFAKELGLPVTFVNNADAAGYAEMGYGAGAGDMGKGVVFMTTFGRGIGTSMFVDGLLVPNLEFGHAQLHGRDAELAAAGALVRKERLSWEQWAERVSAYLSYVERLFWPSLFIVGGGVSDAYEEWLHLVKLDNETPVVPASMRNEAGVVGAAMAAVARAAYDVNQKPLFVEEYVNA